MRLPCTTAVRAELVPTPVRVITPGSTTALTPGAGVRSSLMRPSGLCQILCNQLPEPARSICLAAC